MAKTRQTVSTDELSTFGARLRYQREMRGLSRAELSRLTDDQLTARVIDHLENGVTDVTLERVKLLSNVMNVDIDWFISGNLVDNDDEQEVQEKSDIDEPVEPNESTQSAKSALSPSVKSVETEGNRPEQQQVQKVQKALSPVDIFVNQMNETLDMIETLRLDGFAAHLRKMPLLIDKVIKIAAYLELNDLDEISENRGISFKELSKVFAKNVDEPYLTLVDYCNSESLDDDNLKKAIEEIIERIIDTAIFGTDLYGEDIDGLKLFADKHDIQSGTWTGSWRSHYHIVKSVRPEYRNQAFKGKIERQMTLKHT